MGGKYDRKYIEYIYEIVKIYKNKYFNERDCVWISWYLVWLFVLGIVLLIEIEGKGIDLERVSF